MEYVWNDKVYRNDLTKYCKTLASRYNETLEGWYRIKYNDLYTILYEPISEQKKSELWGSFRTSLDSDPVIEITKTNVVFNKI